MICANYNIDKINYHKEFFYSTYEQALQDSFYKYMEFNDRFEDLDAKKEFAIYEDGRILFDFAVCGDALIRMSLDYFEMYWDRFKDYPLTTRNSYVFAWLVANELLTITYSGIYCQMLTMYYPDACGSVSITFKTHKVLEKKYKEPLPLIANRLGLKS